MSTPPPQKGFRGNINVKPGEIKTDISPAEYEHRVKEIIKCRKDPVYFANNYCYIVSPAKGKHVIKTYPKQQELIKTMSENKE